ncbi:receptor-like protein 44 [Aristolochia californica]|uniref:receptor-like protein 44 n=1 Tax=Aristolochia californica TaxID=171875 RepID=UPI0035E344E0
MRLLFSFFFPLVLSFLVLVTVPVPPIHQQALSISSLFPFQFQLSTNKFYQSLFVPLVDAWFRASTPPLSPIPPTLKSLLDLTILNFFSKRLTGHILPQLAYCTYLNDIDLHNNQLLGPIPQQMGVLVCLSSFNVFKPPLVKNKGLSVMAIVGIGLGSGLTSLVVSFTVVYIWLRVMEQGMVSS